MPTYEYVCDKCGHGFEKFQSMKDDALKTCPKELCGQKRWGKGKIKRQLGTGAGIIFKGSGFYQTDYRSEGYKADAKKDTTFSSDSKPAAKTESKSESKAESKPAAKAETKPAAKPAPPAKGK